MAAGFLGRRASSGCVAMIPLAGLGRAAYFGVRPTGGHPSAERAQPAFATSVAQTFSCPIADAGRSRKGFVMATPERPRRILPANPSEEFLRKLAKRLAKSDDVRLASAQRRLAAEERHRAC